MGAAFAASCKKAEREKKSNKKEIKRGRNNQKRLNKELPKYDKALEENLPALLGGKLSVNEHLMMTDPQICIFGYLYEV